MITLTRTRGSAVNIRGKPCWQDVPLHCGNLHFEEVQGNIGNEDTCNHPSTSAHVSQIKIPKKGAIKLTMEAITHHFPYKSKPC